MIKLLVPLLLLFTLACATDAQTTGSQTGSAAGQASGCGDGFGIMAEFEENPHRAKLKYGNDVRGCFEGEVIAFPMRPKPDYWDSDVYKGEVRRISVVVRVNEERGFTIGHDIPEWPEWTQHPPESMMPEQQPEWDKKVAEALDRYEQLEKQAIDEWEAFVLSASVGDRVKAECDIFKGRRAEQYDPLGKGAFRHQNCVRAK